MKPLNRSRGTGSGNTRGTRTGRPQLQPRTSNRTFQRRPRETASSRKRRRKISRKGRSGIRRDARAARNRRENRGRECCRSALRTGPKPVAPDRSVPQTDAPQPHALADAQARMAGSEYRPGGVPKLDKIVAGDQAAKTDSNKTS